MLFGAQFGFVENKAFCLNQVVKKKTVVSGPSKTSQLLCSALPISRTLPCCSWRRGRKELTMKPKNASHEALVVACLKADATITISNACSSSGSSIGFFAGQQVGSHWACVAVLNTSDTFKQSALKAAIENVPGHVCSFVSESNHSPRAGDKVDVQYYSNEAVGLLGVLHYGLQGEELHTQVENTVATSEEAMGGPVFTGKVSLRLGSGDSLKKVKSRAARLGKRLHADIEMFAPIKDSN